MFYSSWGRTIKIKPHLVYLYSVLSDFFDVKILDLEAEFRIPLKESEVLDFKKKASSLILEHDFDILAISCYTSANYISSVYFAKKIKERFPNKLIIVGGYHPSHVPSDFIYNNSPFDHVISGEIENWIDWFIKSEKSVMKNKYGSKLINSNKDNNIKTTVVPNKIPYYEKIGDALSIGLFLSKGCPYNCNFCTEYKKKWNVLPVETAINLIKQISEK